MDRSSGNSGGGNRHSAGGTWCAVKSNTVNSKATALVLTVLGKLEVNRCGTTTLVVAHDGTTRVARCGVLTGRSIGHAVNDV